MHVSSADNAGNSVLISPLLAALLVFGCSLFGCSDDSTEETDAAVDARPAVDLVSDLGAPDSPEPPTCEATTHLGPVKGEVQTKSCVYRGIPFARPPVGSLRWKPPQEPDAWTGARDATTFGYACPQDPTWDGLHKWGPFDEDCLTLNVWTPSPSPASPAPVMVWINKGESFMEGSSRKGWTDGTNIAERTGTVVVTSNFRLGPLGFLAHPALGKDSGNHGFLDQVAVLKWVQKNISAFGGDPKNVTIFGGGWHGGQSVCVHLVSDGSKGLFHKAIMQSGHCPFVYPNSVYSQVLTKTQAETQGKLLAQKVGCDTATDVAACLRLKDEKEIRKALGVKTAYLTGDAVWGPIIDGDVLKGQPEVLVKAGSFHKVPLLLGTNKNDGYGFATAYKYGTEKDYTAGLTTAFGTTAAKVLKQYPVSDWTPAPAGSGVPPAAWALAEMFTDLVWICPTRRAARAFAAANTSTYLYHFTLPISYGTSLKDPYNGTGSQTIKTFVFHTPQPVADPPWLAWTFNADEEALSWKIMDYWTRFARTGDPNGKGAVSWPKYDKATDQHLELVKLVKAGSKLKQARCDFWETLTP